MSNMIEECR